MVEHGGSWGMHGWWVVGWLWLACLPVQHRLHLSLSARSDASSWREALAAARLDLPHTFSFSCFTAFLQRLMLLLELLRVGHDLRAQLLELLLGVERLVLGLRQPVLDLRPRGWGEGV